MAQDETPTGVHDGWLTEELARLQGGGGKGFPGLPLIASLRAHTGMGLKEARETVMDYARRHDIKVGAWQAGNSPWLTIVLMAVVAWTAYSQIRSWMGLPHDQDQTHMAVFAAVSVVVGLVALILLGLELHRQIKARRTP